MPAYEKVVVIKIGKRAEVRQLNSL